MNKTDFKNLSTADAERELLQLRQWLLDGNAVVLAQVIATWGSSPRPVGSMMVINECGDFIGSVSGGCIEGALICEAQELMQQQGVRTLEFGVSEEQAWQVGLSCGGNIHIFLQTFNQLELIDKLLQALFKHQPVALLTDLNNGMQSLWQKDASHGQLLIDKSTEPTILAVLNSDRSTILKENNKQIFVRSFTQPYRLFLIGAVHIAQILAPMATMAGFQVVLIDPRAAFINETRFTDIKLIQEWPDEALELINLNRQSAVITLSHDPKIDDPALISALNSDAFYVGALGSKRTHNQRLERLKNKFEPANLARINAPIGLNLGGRQPAEIAVAILAQIIENRYQGATQ